MYVYVYTNSGKSRIDEKRKKMVRKNSLKRGRKPESLKKDRVNMTLAKETLDKLDVYIENWNKTNHRQPLNRSKLIDILVRDKLEDPYDIIKRRRARSFIEYRDFSKQMYEMELEREMISKDEFKKKMEEL